MTASRLSLWVSHRVLVLSEKTGTCCSFVPAQPSAGWTRQAGWKESTWRAEEAIAVVTGPALAGKGSLVVVARGLLVAPACLALVDVFRETQDEPVTLRAPNSHLAQRQLQPLSGCSPARVEWKLDGGEAGVREAPPSCSEGLRNSQRHLLQASAAALTITAFKSV